ncbi:MAG TPA: GFA family protein [Solirubrobacteraceae bacterium]|nr:GFA family protein [Solirubrobacteraceae bacterium]
MSVQRLGGCACGAIRYRLESEPMLIHCCHCLNCQRQTGSAFVINLIIEREQVALLAGSPHAVDVPRDDGSVQRVFRCGNCQVIFMRSKVTWVAIPEGTPAFAASSVLMRSQGEEKARICGPFLESGRQNLKLRPPAPATHDGCWSADLAF